MKAESSRLLLRTIVLGLTLMGLGLAGGGVLAAAPIRTPFSTRLSTRP